MTPDKQNTIIEQLKTNRQLKNNRCAFGMWPDPECYGEELGKEMQEKAEEIGRGEFQCYMLHGSWLAGGDEQEFTAGTTYRLRPDYTEEPEIVECEITWHATYHVWGYNSPLADSFVVTESARSCHGFRLIGFKFKDGGVSVLPMSYGDLSSMPGFDCSAPEIAAKEVLHATHVLFRRQK